MENYALVRIDDPPYHCMFLNSCFTLQRENSIHFYKGVRGGSFQSLRRESTPLTSPDIVARGDFFPLIERYVSRHDHIEYKTWLCTLSTSIIVFIKIYCCNFFVNKTQWICRKEKWKRSYHACRQPILNTV